MLEHVLHRASEHGRDLADPLLRYLREITADPENVAVVVMILASVPYRLG